MSIRLKVILPYLILTMIIAVIGVFVVVNLVGNSLSDRLNNQLLESGRAVSDKFVRLESGHIDAARGIIYAEGVAQAVVDGDRGRAFELAVPMLLANGGAQNLILISPDGVEQLHVYLKPNGEVELVEQETGSANLQIVTPFLINKDVNEVPRRAFGINMVNNETYYYTSMPLRLNEEFAGVVVVGTSIRSIGFDLKESILADVIFYGGNGQAIATTLVTMDSDSLNLLSISEAEFQDAILSKTAVQGSDFDLGGRKYRLIRGPLRVGDDLVGVYAVVQPLDYVLNAGKLGRDTYITLFTVSFLVVIFVGFLISRMITKPLYSLVHTSQVIAGGDLAQRTQINSKDEIGELANSFDDMTVKLQERTYELERINEALKRMDKSKTNFIQISAHELRTPLTLIMGYSQMLEQDLQDNPDTLMLARGILEGAERMTDVVDSMLDVSRIDNNALVVRKSFMQVGDVIKKVNKGFAEAVQERNINLVTEGVDTLPSISADPELIQKVFYHLIMNAIKYTPDGGSVKVLGKYLNGDVPPQVEVTVSDTGIGIDPSATQLIFEKFHQTGEVLLHSSGKTKFKGGGPGLGLAIVRGIIEAHGGHIWVESPGHNEETYPGSKFIVSLPVEKVGGD